MDHTKRIHKAKTPAKLLPKTLDAIKLVQAGIDPERALQITNGKEIISERAIYSLKAKSRKYSLQAPSLVRSAQNQIKRILTSGAREEAHTKVTGQGQVVEYTDNIYPTDANILAAASMVYDRYEPTRGQEQAQGGDITYLDLSMINVQVNTPSGGASPPMSRDAVDNSPDEGR